MRDEIRYLFIDGAYLRAVLSWMSERLCGGYPITIVPTLLSSGYRKTFYYDCPPARRASETDESFNSRFEEARELMDRFRSAPGTHVIEGTTTGAKRQRQKQVDVAIAVDMLTHSYRRNMGRATLLAGDLDFKPVVDALVRDGMWVSVWCEEFSASRGLYLAADERINFDVDTVLSFATPQFQRRYPRPDQHGRTRQAEIERAKHTGYSKPFDRYAYLIEKPDRWEGVMRSASDFGQESVFVHYDGEFLKAYMELTRSVVWDRNQGEGGVHT